MDDKVKFGKHSVPLRSETKLSEVTRTLPGTTVFLRENKRTMPARLKFKSKISHASREILLLNLSLAVIVFLFSRKNTVVPGNVRVTSLTHKNIKTAFK